MNTTVLVAVAPTISIAVCLLLLMGISLENVTFAIANGAVVTMNV